MIFCLLGTHFNKVVSHKTNKKQLDRNLEDEISFCLIEIQLKRGEFKSSASTLLSGSIRLPHNENETRNMAEMQYGNYALIY